MKKSKIYPCTISPLAIQGQNTEMNFDRLDLMIDNKMAAYNFPSQAIGFVSIGLTAFLN